ncbi:VOC family protein [Carboxylicivirga sediminis]|uniref:VOC family protein n=1 Tax=Carboxylicivirga sediminis TaxID=2006564 RepID=A0A941F4C1_9BACT|nr:VOC family protein [Carboxylicivirga sediminis]MBR8536184.1 VOC family protein [Carboxylicivirga sediminis]
MATINPYINFNGSCEDAFNFYRNVFGGDFEYVGRYKDMPSEEPISEADANKIMHISLRISNETVLMGSDTHEAFGPPCVAGTNISISVNTDSEKEAENIFNGLSTDGQIIMPLGKTFWGSYFGMFTDKFGINWMVSYDYEQEGS